MVKSTCGGLQLKNRRIRLSKGPSGFHARQRPAGSPGDNAKRPRFVIDSQPQSAAPHLCWAAWRRTMPGRRVRQTKISRRPPKQERKTQ